eukprot:TRINITY_DN10820_c0_g1_i1.p1 TRINITY_DN10820_c0_g1~~TRINITY_DN10820_c0_g1_i1.p1  ORF type:complete len:249 (+),score=19.18 TRINITY_DN10820_c0_g1_i1:454-1200(+)
MQKFTDGSVSTVPISTTIRSNNDDVVIPILGKSGNYILNYGDVSVPKETFPSGWKVEVAPVTTNQSTVPKKSSSCSGVDPDSQPVSITFDLNVYDSKGNKQDVTHLPGPGIKLRVIVMLPESLSDQADKLEFSFLNAGEEIWKPLEHIHLQHLGSGASNNSTDRGERMERWLATTTTSHLTSFAVLMGSSNGGCSRVMWIMSVSFLASTFATAAVVSIIYIKIASLKSARISTALSTMHTKVNRCDVA